MTSEPYVNRYEWLQVLLTILLFCVNFVLFAFVLAGGFPIGLPLGVLEILVGWRMSSGLTFRAAETPTSVRSALGGLRPWVLVFGAFVVIFGIVYWTAVAISLHYE